MDGGGAHGLFGGQHRRFAALTRFWHDPRSVIRCFRFGELALLRRLDAAALFDSARAGWLETFRTQRITTQIILALEPPLCPPALRLLAGRFAPLLLNERLLTLPPQLRCCRHDRFPLCTDIGILRLDCLLHSRLPCLLSHWR